MSNIAIRIENVSKQYRLGAIGGTTLREEMHRFADRLFHRTPPNPDMGKEFLALDGINLEVKKGERLGIIGHNGAGKSTLLKLLARVTAPTTGTISYNGRISSMLEVGTGFHKELTGRENIYMNGAILGMTKREIDSKIDQIIAFAEMEKFIDTPVKRYSSGMYVKLAFAVAAHLDSEIMIMDEVLAVGDMKFQQKCLNKMSQISEQEGRTILYVSHNMNTIRQLCDYCIVLKSGRISFSGDVEKAIALYLDTQNNEHCQHNDLSKRDRNPMRTGNIQLLSLDTYYEDNRIAFGDYFEFSLSFFSKISISNLVFRFIVSTEIGSPVATGTTKKISIREMSNNTLKFSLDSSRFAPGDYLISIVAFSPNGVGNQIRHDSMAGAVSFSIIEQNTSFYGMEWVKSAWGCNVIPEIKVLDVSSMPSH